MQWSNGPFEAVADRVLVARCEPCDVNVGLVVGDAAALLVDVGTHPDQGEALYRQAVREAEEAARHPVPLRWAVLTHDHYDHWFGLLGVRAAAGERLLAAAHAAFGRGHGFDENGNTRVQRELGLDEVPVPDVRIDASRCRAEDPWTLDLGGVTVEVAWFGHAHTQSDLVLKVEVDAGAHPVTSRAVAGGAQAGGGGERGADSEPGGHAGHRPVVFTGDLVEESGRPQDGPDSDLPGWASALDRLLEFGGEDALYIPGHGVPVDADFVRAQGEEIAVRAASAR